MIYALGYHQNRIVGTKHSHIYVYLQTALSYSYKRNTILELAGSPTFLHNLGVVHSGTSYTCKVVVGVASNLHRSFAQYLARRLYQLKELLFKPFVLHTVVAFSQEFSVLDERTFD